jgi:hypothetical protein
MKIKFIYGLIFMLFSLMATSNDTYVAPKLQLKNSKKINARKVPRRGPSSLKSKKEIDLDSDFVTLDEIRGKKKGRTPKFWKFETKN